MGSSNPGAIIRESEQVMVSQQGERVAFFHVKRDCQGFFRGDKIAVNLDQALGCGDVVLVSWDGAVFLARALWSASLGWMAVFGDMTVPLAFSAASAFMPVCIGRVSARGHAL